MRYLYTNLSLPRPLCSRPIPDVRDRQIDRRQTASSLNDLAYYGRGHNNTTDRKAYRVERNPLSISEFSRGKIFGSGRLCSHAAMKFDMITDPGE